LVGHGVTVIKLRQNFERVLKYQILLLFVIFLYSDDGKGTKLQGFFVYRIFEKWNCISQKKGLALRLNVKILTYTFLKGGGGGVSILGT
jgi:hypothetical protein